MFSGGRIGGGNVDLMPITSPVYNKANAIHVFNAIENVIKRKGF